MGLRESFLGAVLVDLREEDSEDFSNTALEKIRLIFSKIPSLIVSYQQVFLRTAFSWVGNV